MNPTNPETEQGSPNPAPSARQAGDSADQAAKPLTPEAELQLIVARSASDPDPADVARVRQLLNEHPHLWRIAGSAAN